MVHCSWPPPQETQLLSDSTLTILYGAYIEGQMGSTTQPDL